VTPAQAGTAAMIGIFRASIPGSSVPGVVSATVVQSLFFTVLSVVIVVLTVLFRPRTVSTGSPSNETEGFMAEHPFLSVLIAIALVAGAVLLWRRLKPRLLELWAKAKAGGAILRDWRRYGLEAVFRLLLLPHRRERRLHVGVRDPGDADTVFLVVSSHMLSGLFAVPPGGVGQTQALDVVTLRGSASSGDIAAFSITQDAVLTIWNVVLGVAVMLWAFGYGQVRDLIRNQGKQTAEPAPPGA
jgi:hypothetical protein